MENKIFKTIFFLSIISMIFIGGDVWADTCNVWTSKTSMSISRGHMGSAVVNNKIYVISGYLGNYVRTNKVEEYDPATNTWTTKADIPTAREMFGAAAVNNKIYAIGGGTPNTTGIVEEYDPATNTWTTKANMPTDRADFGIATVNNKIYVIGGTRNDGGAGNKVEEYDPATNTWTTKANMPTARVSLTAAAVNNKIYAIGGISDGGYTDLKIVEEYDPATNTWTTKANMPTARSYLSSNSPAINGKIYVIGGTSGGSSTNKVEEYDPATNTWTTKANMITGRVGLVTDAVNNKIYAIGGYDDSSYVSINEEYAPCNNGSCGTANGHGYYSTSYIDTSSERCYAGTFGGSFVDNGSSWGWSCIGTDGGTTASCSANKVLAGNSNGQTLKNPPINNLCMYGEPTTPILTEDVWYWFCRDNPGVDAVGYTYKTACGYSDGGSSSYPPETDLCKHGEPSSVITGETYTWTCTGNDSLSVSCSTDINSKCGTANRHGYSATSYIDLSEERCQSGSAFGGVFIDSGSFWNWTCGVSSSSWTINASMPVSGEDIRPHTAVINGKIYIIKTSAPSVHEYNPSTNTWVAKASMPTAREDLSKASKAIVINNKIYVLGGRILGVNLKNNEMYDPATNTWTIKAQMPTTAYESGIVAVNGKIYLIGMNGASRTVYEYNPNTDTWTNKGSAIPNERTADTGGMTAVVDGKIYVIGGNSTGSTDEYDLVTNTWTTKANMVFPIQDGVVAVVDKKIYILGGRDMDWIPKMWNQQYDPTTNTWNSLANVPYNTSDVVPGLAVLDNKIYLMGLSGSSTTRNFYEFNPITNIWYYKTPMNFEKERFGVAVVDNVIYTIGGWNRNENESYGFSSTCFANKVATGNADGQILKNEPLVDLCEYGETTTPILADDVWNWTCTNNPGVDAFGLAYKTTCGSSHGGFSSEPPTDLCKHGTPSEVIDNPLTYDWTCMGDDSLAVTCQAPKEFSCGNNFIDSRDSQTYSTVQIGDQCWMKENLNYTTGNSWCYDDNPANCDIYGRLYNASTAQTACPSGWYLPSDAEFGVLFSFASQSMNKLRASPPAWDGQDSYGFNVLPSGGRVSGAYEHLGSMSGFWDSGTVLGYHIVKQFFSGMDVAIAYAGESYEPNGYAVRCLKGPVDGACGASQGGLSSTPPEAGLCSAGNPSFVTTNATTYTWTCNSPGGGSDANCSSNRISFNNPYDINSDESCWFCEYYYDTGGILREGKLNNGIADLEFKFTTNASDYNSYKFAIGTINDVSQAMQTDGWLSVSSSETLFSGAKVRRSGADQKEGSNGFLLTYTKTYYWWVKLRKPDLTETEWMAGGTLITPEKAFPIVRIAADKAIVTVGTNIQYCANAEGDCAPVCWTGTGAPVVDPDNYNWHCSVCFNSSNQPVACTSGNASFSWVLPTDSGAYMNSTTELSANPVFRFNQVIQTFKPGLAITGSECAAEGETGTKAPLPKWREVSPF